MAQPNPPASQPAPSQPVATPGQGGSAVALAGLLLLYALLIVAGLVLLGVGVARYAQQGDPTLMGLGALAVIVPAALCPLAWAVYARQDNAGDHGASDQILSQLQELNERVMVSDAAKRIAYRQRDREALRKAIREDIDRGDFEAAMVLVNQMSQVYGYRLEAEQFRSEINAAREKDVQQRITESIGHLDEMISRKEWDKAHAEAQKLDRLFPDAPRVRHLHTRIDEARDAHKQEIERLFLEASRRDDVEKAMQLLKELDKYLTEREAEPFREVARDVVNKVRQNIGLQFKLAVHDKEWTRSLEIGEQIMRDFPNTKMATEVRDLIDLLRDRAAGEQAARQRNLAS